MPCHPIDRSAHAPEKAAEGITKLYTNIGMEIARRRKQLGDDLFSARRRSRSSSGSPGPGGGLYREVTRDTEFHGEQLCEGDRVLMMFWAANRDPRAFHDPETIDIHRTNNRHMAFGLGPHRCLGSHHARLMFTTLLRGIITRIPDFAVQWEGVERFEDCGSVYAVRHLPVTFTPGKRLPDT